MNGMEDVKRICWKIHKHSPAGCRKAWQLLKALNNCDKRLPVQFRDGEKLIPIRECLQFSNKAGAERSVVVILDKQVQLENGDNAEVVLD